MMRTTVLFAVGFALAGCSGFETNRSTDTYHLYTGAAFVEPDAVVNAQQWLEEEVVCQREKVLGTRIIRRRCHVPPTEAELALQEEITRSALNHARHLALWEEQRRIESLSEGRPMGMPGSVVPAGD